MRLRWCIIARITRCNHKNLARDFRDLFVLIWAVSIHSAVRADERPCAIVSYCCCTTSLPAPIPVAKFAYRHIAKGHARRPPHAHASGVLRAFSSARRRAPPPDPDGRAPDRHHHHCRGEYVAPRRALSHRPYCAADHVRCAVSIGILGATYENMLNVLYKKPKVGARLRATRGARRALRLTCVLRLLCGRV